MASKSCFASGVDHFLSSCLRGAVAVKLRKLWKDEELVAGRVNEVIAGRVIHRELAGLRALAAMVAAGLIMGYDGRVTISQRLTIRGVGPWTRDHG